MLFQERKVNENKTKQIRSLLLVVILLFSINFISSADSGTVWKVTRFDGKEKELFDISKLNDNQICIMAKNSMLKDIEKENGEKIKYPNSIKIYEGNDLKLKEDRELNKNILNLIFKNEECFDLDISKGYYKIGENSIIITIEHSYKVIYPNGFGGWKVSSSGDESILWTVKNISNNQICIIPVNKNLSDINKLECKTFDEFGNCTQWKEVKYKYPNKIKLKDKLNDIKEDITLIENQEFYCFNLNPQESNYYKIGEESINIEGTGVYNSTNTNVTQESGFAHLNISDPSLVLYMSFDVPDGNATWIEGNNSGALSFDGVNDYISRTVLSEIYFETNYTVSLWFNTKATSSTYNLFNNVISSGNRSAIVLSSGVIRAGHWNGTSYFARSSSSINTNQWYHVVMVHYSNSTNVLYLNNVIQLGASSPSSGSTAGVYIGGDSTSSYPLNGSMDEIMVFNRELNSSEISALYSHSILNSSNLLMKLLLDENNGFTVFDTSGNIKNANIVDGQTRIIYDYSNKSKNGVATNNPYQNYTGGYNGSGDYQFDGINNRIVVPDTELQSRQSHSFSAWFKGVTCADTYCAIMGSGFLSDANGSGIYIIKSSGNAVFQTRNGGTFYSATSPLNSLDGAWHHVVGTRNQVTNETIIYVDGVKANNVTGYLYNFNSTIDFHIGTPYGTTSYPFNGSIDEVMVFNKTLTSTEVEQIYHSQYPRFYPTGEMLFQNLNFGTNNTVNISIPNCQQLNGSVLGFKVNDGEFAYLNSSCEATKYRIYGDLTDANLTIQLNSTPYNFYSPLLIGNITLTDYYIAYSESNAPNFTYIPPNEAINYGTDWDGVNFTAEDDTAVDTFYINDTRFTINDTGYLDDNSILGAGVYAINVSVNDTLGNVNSTIYILTINQYPTSLSLVSSAGWTIIASQYSTITGSDCPYLATCNLYLINNLTTNPYTNIFPAGSYLFTYNVSETTNYTADSISNTLISQVNQTTINETISTTTKVKKTCPKGGVYCDCGIYSQC